MEHLKQFQKENPDTMKYYQDIIKYLKDDCIEAVFDPQMENKIKSHMFDEDYE